MRCLVLPRRICRSVLYLSRPCLTFSLWMMSCGYACPRLWPGTADWSGSPAAVLHARALLGLGDALLAAVVQDALAGQLGAQLRALRARGR